jgi:hypothetical protein
MERPDLVARLAVARPLVARLVVAMIDVTWC